MELISLYICTMIQRTKIFSGLFLVVLVFTSSILKAEFNSRSAQQSKDNTQISIVKIAEKQSSVFELNNNSTGVVLNVKNGAGQTVVPFFSATTDLIFSGVLFTSFSSNYYHNDFNLATSVTKLLYPFHFFW